MYYTRSAFGSGLILCLPTALLERESSRSAAAAAASFATSPNSLDVGPAPSLGRCSCFQKSWHLWFRHGRATQPHITFFSSLLHTCLYFERVRMKKDLDLCCTSDPIMPSSGSKTACARVQIINPQLNLTMSKHSPYSLALASAPCPASLPRPLSRRDFSMKREGGGNKIRGATLLARCPR